MLASAKDLIRTKVSKYAFQIIAIIWIAFLVIFGTAYWLQARFHYIGAPDPSTTLLKDIILFLVIGSITLAFAVANYLWQTDLQRASLLRELTTKFFTDESLYGSYTELISNYKAETYWEVAKAIETMVKDDPALRDAKPIFLKGWQLPERKVLAPGKRRFHPLFFQGSPEEARLDAVLTYCELIVYHINNRHLVETEVEGALSQILHTIANKPFITEYILAVRSEVKPIGPPPPTAPLDDSGKKDVNNLYKVLYEELDKYLDRFRLGKDVKIPTLAVPYSPEEIEQQLKELRGNYKRSAIKKGLWLRNMQCRLYTFPELQTSARR